MNIFCGVLLVFSILINIETEAAHDYGAALKLSLKFYEAQRTGDLPDDNSIPWRKDSFLDDGIDHGLDLTGGYFDGLFL
jgi:hypothetical protein